MSREPSRRRIAFLLLILVVAASQTAADLDRHGKDAARFSRLFLEGKDAEIDAMMTGQMRSAFSAAQRTQIRSSLAQKYGEGRMGDAWLEDKLQGYLRYRVPLFFAKATLDFRVVIDGAGKVAGFFIVPHVERRAVESPDLTVEEEVVDDAHAALRLLQGREGIDRERIFVAGHSLGGTLAPWIAATLEPRPAGVIVLAGAVLPLPEKMLDQTRYIAALDAVVSDEEQIHLEKVEREVEKLRAALDGTISTPSGSVLGAPVGYYASLESHDPPAEAAALGLPVLVLQGKRDYQVTMDDFALWQAALAAGPGACLGAYDGLDHLFRHGTGPSAPQDYDRLAPVAPRVLDDLAAWIKERRCPIGPRSPTAPGSSAASG